MNTMIKTTIYSFATCALLFSLQGCGNDRAGITPTEAKKLTSTGLGTTSITPDDTDGDGIKNVDEENNIYANGKTDPNNPDTDGDGILDGKEVNTYHTDPTVYDSDNDGLCDGDEIANVTGRSGLKIPCTQDKSPYITDPTKRDSDYDSLTDGDEVLDKGTNPTTPDTDKDGLRDDVEVGNTTTSATDPDSDDDGLSDGYEVDVSKTQPNDKDSDNDGVTDGIEVCGTFYLSDNNTTKNFYDRQNSGKVVGVANSISIYEKTNSFTDDVLGATTSSMIATPIKYQIWQKGNGSSSKESAGDSRCQVPADTNNDNDGKIDALDATNDSDGDNRTNANEKSHGSDPLHSGACYTDTTRTNCVVGDLNINAYYPWITQTPDGDKMVKANFVYVPRAKDNNGKQGFWMAKYLAVYTDNTNTNVKFVSGDDKVDNISNNDANNTIVNSKNSLGLNNDIKLPTSEQYTKAFNVVSTSSNTCIKVKNTVGDTNMPVNYENEICEIIPTNSNSVNQEFKVGGTVYIKSNLTFTEDGAQSADPSTQFRAATDYVP